MVPIDRKEIAGRSYTDADGYRYGYQGKYAEKDPETGWNAFELRMYDSRIGRWLSIDPAGEFLSPYVGMGNDPVNKTDPTGGSTSKPFDWYATKNPNGTTSLIWLNRTEASINYTGQTYFNVGSDRSDPIGAEFAANKLFGILENPTHAPNSDNLVRRSFQDFPVLPPKPIDVGSITKTREAAFGFIGGAYNEARRSYLSYKGTPKGETNIEFLKIALTGGAAELYMASRVRTLYRAVDAVEAASIESTGEFIIKGGGGIDVKYFAKSLDDVKWYGERLYPQGYSVIKAKVQSSIAQKHWMPDVDIGAYVFPKETLKSVNAYSW